LNALSIGWQSPRYYLLLELNLPCKLNMYVSPVCCLLTDAVDVPWSQSRVAVHEATLAPSSREGLHVAMLKFSQKWGRRVQVRGGWQGHINMPDDVKQQQQQQQQQHWH